MTRSSSASWATRVRPVSARSSTVSPSRRGAVGAPRLDGAGSRTSPSGMATRRSCGASGSRLRRAIATPCWRRCRGCATAGRLRPTSYLRPGRALVSGDHLRHALRGRLHARDVRPPRREARRWGDGVPHRHHRAAPDGGRAEQLRGRRGARPARAGGQHGAAGEDARAAAPSSRRDRRCWRCCGRASTAHRS